VTRSFQAKLLILAVFVVGAFTGGVLGDLYRTRFAGIEEPSRGTPDPRRPRPPDFEAFEDYLSLTDPQRAQLDEILRNTRERYRELQSKTRPMYREITLASQDEIRAILDEGQLARYEEWIGTLDRRGPGRGRNERQPDAQ
jgi:hypothetical protein